MAKGYSKQVTDRQKSTRALVHTIETNAENIGAGIEATLSRVGQNGGAKAPSLAGFLRTAAKLLTTSGAALEHADKAHEHEMADDVAPRNARDEAAAKARETLVDLRAAVQPTYGDAGLSAVGLSAAVPQDPQVLLSVGKKVHALLGTVDLGEPRRKGVAVDVKVFMKELAASLKSLELALDDVARELREGQATLAAKTKALQTNDDDFQRVAAVVEALCRFAGLDEVAARARPSARKPGQTEVEPTTDPTSQPTE